MTRPIRVFISYSRIDGTATAHRLRDVLLAASFEPWLDIDRISGGSSWSQSVERALSNCDVLIAVLSEGSFHSHICRAEQQWALEEGKLVIPVLIAPDVPRPVYLKDFQFRRFPDEVQAILDDLRIQSPPPATCARRRHYDTVPLLPEDFLLRESALSDLRNLVLSDTDNAEIAVTAVAGMGGIGKTVLTIALAHDVAVRRAFPDGIAWVTFGREWNNDAVHAMHKIAAALGADLARYADVNVCRNRYAELLHNKAALVIVDDCGIGSISNRYKSARRVLD